MLLGFFIFLQRMLLKMWILVHPQSGPLRGAALPGLFVLRKMLNMKKDGLSRSLNFVLQKGPTLLSTHIGWIQVPAKRGHVAVATLMHLGHPCLNHLFNQHFLVNNGTGKACERRTSEN